MKKQKLLFFTFLIVSLFFISQVNAISDNDINFSWITSSLYDNDSIDDFDVDDSLSHTTYNDTDYYEHVNNFESYNYTNDLYIENKVYLENCFISSMCYFNNYYYFFPIDVLEEILIYDLNMTNLYNISVNFDTINFMVSVISDDNYFYVFGYYYIATVKYYELQVYNLNFEYLNTLVELNENNYICWDITYYNQSLFIATTKVSDGHSNILQYDLNGNLQDSHDIETYVLYVIGFAYYENKFYATDDYDNDRVNIFDNNMNYITQVSPDIPAHDLKSMFIYNDICFYVDGSNEIKLLDINFDQQDYYDIIDYYPESNGLFDSVDNVNISLQEQTNSLGYYDGIYNFDDLSEFYNESTGHCYYESSDFKSHKEVLHLVDYNEAGSRAIANIDLDYQMLIGTIEFYWSSSDTYKKSYFSVYDNTNYPFFLDFYHDNLEFYNGSYYTVQAIMDNVWYHIQLNFSFISNEIIISVDGINRGSYIMINGYSNIDKLEFSTHPTDLNYHTYYDSLGIYINNTGLYNASFNFNNMNGFNITDNSENATYELLDYYEGHVNVINISDYGSNELFGMNVQIDDIDNDTIELWFNQQNYGNNYLYIQLYDDTTHVPFYLKFTSNALNVYDNDGFSAIYSPIILTQWYLLKIQYDCSLEIAYIYIDNNLIYTSSNWYYSSIYMDYFRIQTNLAHDNIETLFDGLGFASFENYTLGMNNNDIYQYNSYEINQNLQYGIEYNGFWNEINIMNDNFEEIISIECLNGTYYINGTTTNYNVFFNDSQYVYDTWKINININQNYENGSLYVYNESNSLLFSQDFNTNCSGNIKYIKYIQHYQDTNHFIYLSNFSIYSNNTHISGKKGYISYGLDLIDTNIWNFEYSSSLTINAYGRYEIYVSNESYQDSSSLLYQISGFIDFRNEERVFDLSYLNEIVINPYLIISSMNGQYKLNSIKINGSNSNFILYDDRNNVYLGSLETSNINTSQSYFYVLNGRLNYKITFDDDNLEYMKLAFNIEDITNENYQFIHLSYFNSSNTNVLFQIKLKNNDATYDNIDMGNYYNSEISNLDQDKITIQLEFLLSDNDLENNASFSGYFSIFSFSYNAQITISTFITSFMIMLLPIIIILSLTFGISHVLRKDKTEIVNKSLFFPIFVISSIIVFILGFFDAWILFIMIIATIAYILNRKEELS